jgi:hypothetical protein
MTTRLWYAWTSRSNASVYKNLLRTEIFTGGHNQTVAALALTA